MDVNAVMPGCDFLPLREYKGMEKSTKKER
jgi:hypothetical protein